MKPLFCLALAATTTLALSHTAMAADPVACEVAGPQTPRDIASLLGNRTPDAPFAPPASEMNLCNIHTHTNAEHKGPGFSLFVSPYENGGYACNDTENLTGNEMKKDPGVDYVVEPGKTIEVHWVHTTCDTPESAPGEGLGPCLACPDAKVRVETQVFLVVNDSDALDFAAFIYDGNMVNGLHQPRAIPDHTGEPVQFWGSTTGPSYDNKMCSPYPVTWSVRPDCARVSAQSLNAWYAVEEDGTRADGSMNIFKEDHSHGVRQLVKNPDFLSEIGG